MRRIVLLLVVVVAGVCAMMAEKFQVGGLWYKPLSDGVSVAVVSPPEEAEAEYLKGVRSLVIPGEVTLSGKKYAVTELQMAFCGEKPYDTMADLREVEIPEGVTSVHDFFNMPYLESIKLPDSVEKLKGFHNLPSLKTVVFPQGLTEIEMESFQWVGLQSLTIPVNMKGIGYQVLTDLPELTELHLSNVEYVETYAFQVLPKLKKLVLPPSFVESVDFTLSGGFDEVWFESDGVEREWHLSVGSFVCKPKAVYCARPNPPVIDGAENINIFDIQGGYEGYMFGGINNLKNVTLYVPRGCTEAFKSTLYWGMMDIREYDFQNGIPVVSDDGAVTKGSLYDLHGRKVAQEGVSPGVYVRDGRKVVVR